jgi:GYF domain 2
MARERWFFARDNRRQGPFPRQQLVESLLGQPDPRSSLIWRHGLPAWTPAGEVPEIDRHLAPFVKARTVTPPPAETSGATADPAEAPRMARPGEARPGAYGGLERAGQAASASKMPYAIGGGVILVAVLAAWLFWPSSSPAPSTESSSGSGSSAGAGTTPGSRGTERATSKSAPTGPGATAGSGTTPTGSTKSGQSAAVDQEGELPSSELKKLRGVGSWSGEQLTITLYNGSVWRVTEISVRTSRLTGDQFVDADKPAPFLPIGANVEAPVANLLNRVAPGRRRPSVNPDDTVKFEATVGAQPEAYRWRIEGAKGYPPRGS